MSNLPALTDTLPPARIDDHPVAGYLARLTSAASRRTMVSKLGTAARIILSDDHATAWDVPWHRLQPVHLDAVRAVLAERCAPSTANCCLAAIRGVLKACWRADKITGEQLSRLLGVEAVRGSSPPAGRAIEPVEMQGLFIAAVDPRKPNRAARDRALLALMYGAGLRRAELAALDLADFDAEREEVIVRKGKGNRARVVPLALGAAEHVAAWIGLRGDCIAALLMPVDKGDNIKPSRITPDAIGRIVKRLAADAGVKDVSAHDFRRSLIGDLLSAGADLATVQQLAGHQSPQTTSRYDRRPAEARRRAARLVRVPAASASGGH